MAKKQRNGSFLGKLKRIDMFGSGAQLNIDGQETVQTWLGALLTFSIVMLCTIYGQKRMEVLLGYGDTTHTDFSPTRREQDDWFNQTDTHFNFAWGMAYYNDWYPHSIDYEGYIEIAVYSNVWKPGFDANGKAVEDDEVLEDLIFATCTEESRQKFYSDLEINNDPLNDYFQHLQCLNDDSLSKLNVLNAEKSDIGANIYFSLSRCGYGGNKERCKSDEEIDQFILDHQFYIQYNQQTYEPEGYGEDGYVSRYVASEYFDLDPNQFHDYRSILQRQSLNSEESLIFGGEREADWYKMDWKAERRTSIRTRTAIFMEIQVYPHVQNMIFQRTVYNSLDLLGDIGGLFGAFQLIGAIVLAPFSGQISTTFMASLIFSEQDEAQPSRAQRDQIDPESTAELCKEAQRDIKRRIPFMQRYFADILNSWWCWSKSQRKRRIQAASDRIDGALDVVTLIRNQFAFEGLLRTQMTRLQRYYLRRRRVLVLTGDAQDGQSSHESLDSDDNKFGAHIAYALRREGGANDPVLRNLARYAKKKELVGRQGIDAKIQNNYLTRVFNIRGNETSQDMFSLP